MTGSGASGNPNLPPPSPDEWRRLEPLIDAALDVPPERRADALAELSGGDVVLRAELERLVAECEHAYPLLERPAADRFPAVFGDEDPPVPETIAGRYRVIREIGRGGMAIVYVARDLKHGREVAVKIVRPELAATLGRARFLREIEIAARLRHPYIVPVYDSGEMPTESADADGIASGNSTLFYVMPYETGHSLRERLAADGSVSVADAVVILHDICDALAHAHRHGIVHRDIKPENVLLSGQHAMITDFGVARAASEAAESSSAIGGMVFGTPTYMAPEQAANDARVDHRADIFSVGVVAYELLAGLPPAGDGEPRSLRSAPARDALPPLASVRADVPDALAGLIMKCLATDPLDRWQSADELLAQLTALSIPSAPSAFASPIRRRAMFVGAAVGVGSLIALVFALIRNEAKSRPPMLGQASRLTSDPGLEVQPSMSPDGRYVAYAAGHSLRMHVVVRAVGRGNAIPMTSDTTASEWLPRWSRDGTRILFLARGGVFSAPAFGGASRQEVAARPGAIVTSATWSPDGREIAYVRGDSLLARHFGTNAIRLITTGADLHSCRWSPDAARLACVSGNSFYVTIGTTLGLGPMFANRAPSRIVLIPASGGQPMAVTDSGSLHQSPAWSRDGKTLYYVSSRQGPRDIYALDVRARGAWNRQPMRVTTGMGAQSIDFSADGKRVVYAAYTSNANVWTLPIPRGAPALASSARPVTSGNQTIEGVRVSPDGRWLLYDSDLSGNSDVYRVPVGGGDAERLTHGPLDEFRGVMSPNGKELVYHSYETGSRNLFLLPLRGGPVQQLTRSSGQHAMANWSPDGSALAFFDISTAEVMVMRRDTLNRWGRPRLVARNGVRPEWSADGRTLAYVSRADGRIGVVSADSGAPRDLYVPRAGDPLAELAIFSADGREIYFKSHDARGRASFWSILVVGGRPRLLVRFHDPARASNRFEFASDGKRLYFTLEDRQSDIWVADVQ